MQPGLDRKAAKRQQPGRHAGCQPHAIAVWNENAHHPAFSASINSWNAGNQGQGLEQPKQRTEANRDERIPPFTPQASQCLCLELLRGEDNPRGDFSMPSIFPCYSDASLLLVWLKLIIGREWLGVRTGVCKIIAQRATRLKRFVFQRCRLLLVVNVKKHTQWKYAIL